VWRDSEARRELEQALRRHETHAEGSELLKLVRLMEASKQDANMLFNRGSVSKAHDKYSEALKLCEWAVSFNAQLLSNRGACHLKLGNYKAVIQDCSQALDLSPKYIKALLHRVCASPGSYHAYKCLHLARCLTLLATYSPQMTHSTLEVDA